MVLSIMVKHISIQGLDVLSLMSTSAASSRHGTAPIYQYILINQQLELIYWYVLIHQYAYKPIEDSFTFYNLFFNWLNIQALLLFRKLQQMPLFNLTPKSCFWSQYFPFYQDLQLGNPFSCPSTLSDICIGDGGDVLPTNTTNIDMF